MTWKEIGKTFNVMDYKELIPVYECTKCNMARTKNKEDKCWECNK